MTRGQLSRAGAGAGAAHEACYLFAYPDPASGGEPWTIGVGHTVRAGPPVVRRGDRVSFARAFDIYAVDMGAVERDVRAAIKPELAQHQFDAACIFHLNTGAIRSGSIDEKLNRGDEAGALKTWSQYVNAAGKHMPGLVTRRAEEIALWQTGRYPARKVLIKDTATGSGRYVAASAIPWRGEGAQPGETIATPVPVVAAERPPVVIVRSPVRDTRPAAPIGKVAAPVVPWYVRLWRLITG
jgi:GH24 family phage-related lysozyme (muramidase)